VSESQMSNQDPGISPRAASPFESRVGALRDAAPVARRRRSSLWVVAMVLLVLAGIFAAVIGARAVARSDADKAQLASRVATGEIASTLKLALQHEEDLIVSANAFVSGNPNASPAGFDKWAESVHAMQRYPELQDFGFVILVPASHLAAVRARMNASPLLPLGPRSEGSKEPLQILPAGRRPFYCLATAGLARNAAIVLSAGLDFCALAPTLIVTRDSGLASYAPFVNGNTTTLGVETPIYRGGVTPSSVTGRRRAFLGWIGELLTPNVVVERALEGHPNVAAVFRYDSRDAHIAFSRGSVPTGAQSTKLAVNVGREAGLNNTHEGWTVQSFTAAAAGGVFENANALILLIGGILLSVVVGLLMLVLGLGRKRALSLVHEKTRELFQKNRELSHQALHDALTGLPNRALVLDRAAQLLARAARQPAMKAGALFIDIDGFKHVNDNFGHAAGDQLLKTVAERLQSTVRDQDTAGRLGGDEFVVLVESTDDETTPDLLAERLTDVLREPLELDDGRRISSVTASIGVAVGQYDTPDELLRDADLALYAAKAAGKNRYALFNATMQAGVDGHLQVETAPTAARGVSGVHAVSVGMRP